MGTIRMLIADSTMSSEQLSHLSNVLSLLNSSNVLVADIEQQVKQGKLDIDTQQKAWLFSELVMERRRDRKVHSKSGSSGLATVPTLLTGTAHGSLGPSSH